MKGFQRVKLEIWMNNEENIVKTYLLEQNCRVELSQSKFHFVEQMYCNSSSYIDRNIMTDDHKDDLVIFFHILYKDISDH